MPPASRMMSDNNREDRSVNEEFCHGDPLPTTYARGNAGWAGHPRAHFLESFHDDPPTRLRPLSAT
jgi:hypothetical protein